MKEEKIKEILKLTQNQRQVYLNNINKLSNKLTNSIKKNNKYIYNIILITYFKFR